MLGFGTNSGVKLITQERTRQVVVEKWTPEHDDQHRNSELAMAAVCYIMSAVAPQMLDKLFEQLWPWDKHWYKPTVPRQSLVKAGALLAAEIDRRLRVERRHVKLKTGGLK